jgi:hypothetical protein
MLRVLCLVNFLDNPGQAKKFVYHPSNYLLETIGFSDNGVASGATVEAIAPARCAIQSPQLESCSHALQTNAED